MDTFEAASSVLNNVKGKTIVEWKFLDDPYAGDDPWPGEGVRLTFTDGTTLTIYERQQAGKVSYK